MLRNQLGRRNLDPKSFTLLIGDLYIHNKKPNELKNPEGLGGKSGKIDSGKNCHKQNEDKTEQQIAKEHNVSPRTVRNSAEVAKALDTPEKRKDWMLRNQLGRRNLDPKSFTLLIGDLYIHNKKPNELKNPDGCKGKSSDPIKGQNDLKLNEDNTAQKIAKEHNEVEAQNGPQAKYIYTKNPRQTIRGLVLKEKFTKNLQDIWRMRSTRSQLPVKFVWLTR